MLTTAIVATAKIVQRVPTGHEVLRFYPDLQFDAREVTHGIAVLLQRGGALQHLIFEAKSERYIALLQGQLALVETLADVLVNTGDPDAFAVIHTLGTTVLAINERIWFLLSPQAQLDLVASIAQQKTSLIATANAFAETANG